PRGIESRFSSSFDAVKIHFPSGRGIEALDEAIHWQRQLRDPGLGGFIQDNATPQSTLQIVFLARPDIEIDPKTIRADFEFFVTAELRWVGLKKNFRNVAVPKLVAASIGLGIGENSDIPVFRAKSKKKSLRSPQ